MCTVNAVALNYQIKRKEGEQGNRSRTDLNFENIFSLASFL